MNENFSQQLRIRFGLVVLALWFAGCATIDSKMWVAKDSGQDPCDSFSLGERPVVFIQGFEGAQKAALQLSRDGKIVAEKTYELHSGETQTSFGQSYVTAGPGGGWVEYQPVTEQVNTGDRIDLREYVDNANRVGF
jgi:hypothetical protein